MNDKQPNWTILHGDALTILEDFPPGTFDAVITDPPYASGGRTPAEKNRSTARTQFGKSIRPKILPHTKVIKGREYCMYFPLL